MSRIVPITLQSPPLALNMPPGLIRVTETNGFPESPRRLNSSTARSMTCRTSALNTFRMRNVYETPQVVSFPTEEVREIGEPWKTVGLFKALLGCFHWIHARVYQRDVPHKAVLCQSLITVWCNTVLSFFALFTLPESNTDTEYYIILLNAMFTFPLMAHLSCQLYRVANRYQENEQTLFSFMLNLILYYSLGLTCVIMLWNSHQFYSIFFICIIYLTCILFNLFLTSLLLLSPFLFVGFFIETFIRMLICRLKCPEEEKVFRKYKYQVFYYQHEACNASSCVICLGKFIENEHVCFLQCHTTHIFHQKCIIDWLESQTNCPICRHAISFVF